MSSLRFHMRMSWASLTMTSCRSDIMGKRRAAASTSSTSVSRPYNTVSLKSLRLSSTTVPSKVLTISEMKKGSSPCRTYTGDNCPEVMFRTIWRCGMAAKVGLRPFRK